MNRLMVVFAVVWTIGIGVWFVFYGDCATTSGVATAVVGPNTSPDDPPTGPSQPAVRVETEHCGMTRSEWPTVPIVLSIPVLFAAVPLLVRSGRRTVAGLAAILTLAFVVVGAMSVGLLYPPSSAALALAAAWPPQRGERWERWFSWLVALTAAVGGVWYYSFLALPDTHLGGPFIALMLLVIGVALALHVRDWLRGDVVRTAATNRTSS